VAAAALMASVAEKRRIQLDGVASKYRGSDAVLHTPLSSSQNPGIPN